MDRRYGETSGRIASALLNRHGIGVQTGPDRITGKWRLARAELLTVALVTMTSMKLSEVVGDPIDRALELEQLDVDLYRSVRLWRPVNGRGAFGMVARSP
jgi:hypothetical protein